MRSHSIGVVRMGRGKFTLVAYSTVLESYLCSFCRFGRWMFIMLSLLLFSLFLFYLRPHGGNAEWKGACILLRVRPKSYFMVYSIKADMG